ncbi:hypothetical protein Tco_0317946 [Tanacetum coccineum]
MASLHQQTLADAGSDTRPPMLEKGSYVLWANRFIRYIDRKKGQGIRIKHSTEYGPFKLGMVPTSNSTTHTPNEPYVKASRAKRAARNHDHLALVANSYTKPSASSSTQQYYVTHPPSVLDHDDDYQGEILAAREDTLSTAMMLLARTITKHFSTPTNNWYTGGNRRNAGNQGRYDVNQGSAAGNDIVQPTIAKTDTMRLAAKYEAGVHLDDEENDFMLTSAIGDDHLEEINASVIMMDRLQPIVNDSDAEPK